MIQIFPYDYQRLAVLLKSSFGSAEWFSGSCELDLGSLVGRFTASVVIYRRSEVLPEGFVRPVSNVVPVWWEFSTGDFLNDFSFAELKNHLIDHE